MVLVGDGDGPLGNGSHVGLELSAVLEEVVERPRSRVLEPEHLTSHLLRRPYAERRAPLEQTHGLGDLLLEQRENVGSLRGDATPQAGLLDAIGASVLGLEARERDRARADR